MTKAVQLCPVCENPVGLDPHEECFEIQKSRDGHQVDESAMPCPACGAPMSDDHACE